MAGKISKFIHSAGYERRVTGMPKTIDKDLRGTEHCPGFASAAKYLAVCPCRHQGDGRT